MFCDVPIPVSVGSQVEDMLVVSLCEGRGEGGSSEGEVPVCYPDETLSAAQRQMVPRGLRQLAVVTRGGKRWQERGRKVVGVLDREGIRDACQ